MIANNCRNLDPDEMAFRRIYWHLIETEQLRKVFRPGRRECGSFRGYCMGQAITAKPLKFVGADWAGIEPVFYQGLAKRLKVEQIQCKRIGDLSEGDFEGAGPELKTIEQLRFHLGLIYNLSWDDLKSDEWVTIITFSYPKNMERAVKKHEGALDDLLKSGSLRFANRPEKNPKTLNFQNLMVTFIQDDYPAKTPVMWNSVYEELKMNFSSVALVATHDFENVLEAARQDSRYVGGGLGVGLKDEALVNLDESDPLAEMMGAANFVTKTKTGNLRGFNTDGVGFIKSIEKWFSDRHLGMEGKEALILGAGGTASAIALVLARSGFKVLIVNRTLEKASKLAARINQQLSLNDSLKVEFFVETDVNNLLSQADLIVNTTTKGAVGELSNYSALAPAKLPATPHNLAVNHQQAAVLLDKIKHNALVVDVILKYEETPLIAGAKAVGISTMDGIPMVINQAVEAFWLLHVAELEMRNINKEQIAQIMRKAAGYGI